MNSSDQSRNPDPSPGPFKLDPEAAEALGKHSPELVWLQVRTMIQQAIDLQFRESDKMRRKAELPIDLPNLTEILAIMNPVKGVNQLLYANPKLNLQRITKTPPLEVLRAILNMMTVSDRYQSLTP